MPSRILLSFLVPFTLAAAPVVKPAPPTDAQIVQRWMAGMTLSDKVAQLVVIAFYGENPNSRSTMYRRYVQQVQQLKVGGLVVLNRVNNGVVRNAVPATMAAFINRMQRLSRIPLIVGGDFERASSMRMTETARFPHAMAFAAARDVDASRALGAVTARESRAMGVQWVFAPVADVNNNPDNPVINTRSYSENPQEVADHVKAYIEGARSEPKNKVLVTVKHFPGHGDTNVDTHFGLAKVEAPRKRLDELELVPFRAAVESGVDAVMTAHLWVPALDDREVPATVSPAVLTDLLRKQLGFRGIITTDAMDMDGLRKQMPHGEAAVRAIEAGADVLLIPSSATEAVRAVVAAVLKGRVSRKRIDSSLQKVLEAKVKLGLHKAKIVDIEALSDALDWDEDEALAARVAEKAVTLVRNENGLIPLRDPASACWLVMGESLQGQHGRKLMEALSDMPAGKRLLLGPDMPQAEIEDTVKQINDCGTVVAAVYAGPRSTGFMSDSYSQLLEGIQASGKPMVLVALGNPYLLRGFPKVPAYLVTFSTTPPSELAAVKAVLGKITIQGHMPVSIPGLAKYGDGIQLPIQ